MKNRILIKAFIFISSVLGIILSGCTSSKYVYDKSIPEEQLCILKIPLNCSVVRFNDSKTHWNDTMFYGFRKDTMVKIPAGEHTLIIDYFNQELIGYRTFRITKAENIKITFEFQPGKTYEIFSRIIGNEVHLTITPELSDLMKLLLLLPESKD
jgi:hypothetical protein